MVTTSDAVQALMLEAMEASVEAVDVGAVVVLVVIESPLAADRAEPSQFSSHMTLASQKFLEDKNEKGSHKSVLAKNETIAAYEFSFSFEYFFMMGVALKGKSSWFIQKNVE